MRTSELELLLNMIEADEEEVSVENEDSLTTNKFELSIQDTELNTENAATEIPKSKIINNNPSQDIEEKDEIDLSLNCKLCQKKFSCKAKLKQHQEKEKNPCDVCLKLFCTKKELDSHKKIKHKQKKFECDSCSKDFDTKYHLNRHYKSRNLQTCEHCGLVLCNQVDMIRHVSNSHKV